MTLRALVLIGTVGAAASMATSQQAPPIDCPVTQPNHHAAPEGSEAMPPGMATAWHGNDTLGTALWPNGAVVFRLGGPGTVLSDGALRMKFFWLKTPGTRLTVEGHRTDDKSIVLRSDISREFDSQGQQPSHLIFATPGCWRVTARAGGETLSFVTRVVTTGSGFQHAGRAPEPAAY